MDFSIRKISLTTKLSVVITLAILIVLSSVELYFDYHLRDIHFSDAKGKISNGYQRLAEDLIRNENELKAGVGLIEADESMSASIDLINTYQDKKNYNAFLIDEEKKTIAGKLLDWVKLTFSDDIALYDRNAELIAAVSKKESGYVLNFMSYNSGETLFGRQEKDYEFEPVPQSAAKRNPLGVQPGLSSGDGSFITYEQQGDGLILTAHRRILDSASHEFAGTVRMSRILDGNYFKKLSRDVGVTIGMRTGSTAYDQEALPGAAQDISKIQVARTESDYVSVLKKDALNGPVYFLARLDKTLLNRALHEDRRRFFLLLASVAVFSLFLTRYLIRRSFARPLAGLMTQIRKIEDQDYSSSAPISTGDELETISVNVNRLALAIREREHQLREAEQRWKFALEGAGDGVWDWNPQTDQTLFSRRWKEMLGYAEDEFPNTGAAWGERLHPDDKENVIAALNDYFAGRRPAYTIEFRMRCKDGGWKWILARGMVVDRDADGKPLRMIGTHTDITDHKRIQAELEQARDYLAEREIAFRTLVENTPDTIVRYDRACRRIYANPALVGMIARPEQEIVGKTPEESSIPSEQVVQYQQKIRKVLETGQPETFLLDWVNVEGKRIYTDIRLVAERNQDGEVVSVLGIGQDITDRMLLEQGQEQLRNQLQQAQKMEAIGQLTGGIAHDFNNILAAILGYTGLALEHFVPDKESKLASYLREVQIAGERARDLIAKMLAFSRGAKGESIAFDAGPLVKEVAKTLRSVIPSTIGLDTRIDDGLPSILGDPVQLHQVLMNLAINARDAIGEHGRIDISLRRHGAVDISCDSCHQGVRGDYVELAVSDNGSGIPPEIRRRIFDPFFTTKAVGKGTGMGLSMVHGIMHEHGGHILVDSELGKGTTIRLLFALAATAEDPSAGDGGERALAQRPTSARVMVVDDEAVVGRMLGEVLEAHGHRATVLADGVQALAMFEGDPSAWDIVITDQTMPGISGADLSRKMLSIRPDIPILLCTGYSSSIDEAGATAIGIKKYFQKPVSAQALLDEIVLSIQRRPHE